MDATSGLDVLQLAIERMPARRRGSRRCSTGCRSGETPVAHRSASVISGSLSPGRVGAGGAGVVPGRCAASSANPAAQRASRRPRPQASNAPAVASASSWAEVRPARRDRSVTPVNGASPRASTMRRATSGPMPRTESRPRRTASAPSRRWAGTGSGVPGTHSVRSKRGWQHASSPWAPEGRRCVGAVLRGRRVRGRPGRRSGSRRVGARRPRDAVRRPRATAGSRSPSAGCAAARRGTPRGSAA